MGSCHSSPWKEALLTATSGARGYDGHTQVPPGLCSEKRQLDSGRGCSARSGRFTALKDPKPLNTSLSLKQTESTQAPSLVFAGQALRQGGTGPASTQQVEHSQLLRHGQGYRASRASRRHEGTGRPSWDLLTVTDAQVPGSWKEAS